MTLLITPHARQRWSERGDQRDIREAIESAVPFGGQYGNNELWRDDDICFVVRQKSSRRVVVTVLPLDFAVANMQANGMKVDHEQLGEMQKPKAIAPPKSLTQIASGTTEQLQEWQSLGGDIGCLAHQILSLRMRIARQIDHMKQQELKVAAIVNAAKALVPEDQLREFYDLVDKCMDESK